MRYLCVLFIIFANINVALSADGESYFYQSASLSSAPTNINVQQNDLWLKNTGFNWKVLPNFNVDVNLGYGFFDIESHRTNKDTLTNADESSTSDYQGLFGAALIQRNIDKLGTVYAKGGLNWFNRNSLEPILVNTALNDITPFVSVGATIPSPLQKNLELNVELSYQNLQLDEPNTIFTMGAKYRF